MMPAVPASSSAASTRRDRGRSPRRAPQGRAARRARRPRRPATGTPRQAGEPAKHRVAYAIGKRTVGGFGQHAAQLADEKRVAAGTGAHRGRHRSRHRPTGHLAELLRHLRLAQPAEMQASHRRLARQRGERVEQQLPTGCLGIAVVDHDQQARIGKPPARCTSSPSDAGSAHCMSSSTSSRPAGSARPQHVRDRLEQPEPLLGHGFRAPVRQRHVGTRPARCRQRRASPAGTPSRAGCPHPRWAQPPTPGAYRPPPPHRPPTGRAASCQHPAPPRPAAPGRHRHERHAPQRPRRRVLAHAPPTHQHRPPLPCCPTRAPVMLARYELISMLR